MLLQSNENRDERKGMVGARLIFYMRNPAGFKETEIGYQVTAKKKKGREKIK